MVAIDESKRRELMSPFKWRRFEDCKFCPTLPRGCRRAMKEFNFKPEETALVGDQIFADVMAGRLCGLRTFKVAPISPEEEHWFTRIKRPFENVVLRSFKRRFPEGVWIE